MGDRVSLDPLPYPVYFVRNDPDLCAQLADVTEMPPFEQFYRHERGGSSSWIVQTYLQLKVRGLAVQLVPRYVPGAICVVSREELMQKQLLRHLPYRCHLVVCQQDRPRPSICEHRVVQNRLNVLGDRDYFLPHWCQPELKPRDPQRGDRIETLVFKGRWYYVPEEYKSESFLQALQAIGVQFTTDADYHVDLQSWTDYTQADVLLAVRQRSDRYLQSKPPTKLINAWMAGCPAMLGNEPAYEALRQSELDYLIVNSPEEAIAALTLLQSQPQRYRAMIENGWQRAQAFTADRLALEWRNLLAGPVAIAYEQWLQDNFLWRWVGRPLQFGYRLVQQEQERRQFNRLTGRSKR